MEIDLFAGIAVSDLERVRGWYDALFGDVETFAPNEHERVWTVADGKHLYVELRPESAGRAMVTLFVGDLEAFIESAAQRDVRPTARETYDNGVRKATYRDPDGNEIGVGGAPIG